jgi:hypothetical protein
LQEAVRSLPPIPPGKARVFRGQTTDYPTITPAAYRNHLQLMSIWHIYSRFLLEDITRQTFDGAMSGEEFRVWTIWLEAVAQHYGSGSQYLDVSYNVESAAWFALHPGEWTTEHSVLGPPGPPSPYDLPGETKWLKYTAATGPGFVYAFDVEVWDGKSSSPPDLALVDLSLGPQPFRTPRMLAQEGCLIRTGTTDHYDLRQHRVAGTPIEIAAPLAGSAFAGRTVEEMFPAPDRDPWYRRFLSIPMMPEVDTESHRVVLQRPLPVTLYRGESEAYNSAIGATETFLYPALLHRALQQRAEEPGAAADQWWRAVAITEATPIVLEAALLHAFPPAESDLWNHELLLADSNDTAPVYSKPDEPAGEQAGLRNVLFQFSLLEEIFWERAEQPGVHTTLRRGLWMARHGEEWVAVLLCQDFPGTQVKGWAPALIRLDPVRRRLIFKPAGTAMEWTELGGVPELGKPVILALHLLRALSPAWKPEATPRLVTSSGKDGGSLNRYLVAVIDGAARLIRVPDPARVADWFVARDAQGEPYTSPQTGIGAITIEDSRKFAEIPADVFRQAMSSAAAAQKA